jgi:hypothetical protein
MENNKILRSVQEKINKIDNFDSYFDKEGVIIFDKRYEPIKVANVDTTFNVLGTEDGRGRKAGDKTFMLIPEGKTMGWERVDVAFPGDTILLREGKDGKDGLKRTILSIEGDKMMFVEGAGIYFSKYDKKDLPDYLLDIGGEDEILQEKTKQVETKKSDVVLNPSMNIKEKIEALKLIPLYPDKNYNYTSFELKEKGLIISIKEIKKEADLVFYIDCLITPEMTDFFIGGYISNYEDDDKIIESIKFDFIKQKTTLPEIINVFNEKYSELANKFNEILLKTLKEELEEEKKKKEEEEKKKEQEKQDQQSQEGESEESESEEGQEGKGEDGDESEGEGEGEGEGEEGEGEGEEGEGKEGEGEGEGEEGKEGEQGKGSESAKESRQGKGSEGGKSDMSSEDIQKLIDEINKDINKNNKEGQSESKGDSIDLEDFLEEIDKNGGDNDFTNQYNNKDLKDKIDRQKSDKFDKELDDLFPENQEYEVNNVLSAIKSKFQINDDEIKRRFPTKNAVSGFISTLSKEELNDLSEVVGIPKEISNIEKIKTLTNNLLTEIENI